jgi:uncharacterized tellurite resistance protein B-like protein
MLDRLLNVLAGREATPIPAASDGLALAVAALLIETARMDDAFGAKERAIIEGLLERRFALSPPDVEALLAEAQRRVEYSAQYFPFTSRITRELSAEERAEIVEMLWRVAYADGVLDPHEDALIRQIAGLIHVPDRARGLARQRALAGRAAKGEAP